MNSLFLALDLESNKSYLTKLTFFSALPPFRGGISDFSDLLLKQLSKIAKVEAYTFKKQYPDFLFPGKTQYSESNKNSFPRIASTFNPFTYIRAALILRKSKPDIFVTNYWMTFFGPMMALFAYCLKRKTKKIAIIHNLVPHEKRFFDSYFNRLFVGRFDGFVVLSDAVKSELIKIHPNAKCLVMKHPPYNQFGQKISRIDAHNKLGTDETKKTLLFFGLIRDYKGLDTLLNAFSFLDQNFQLIIAGEVYGDEKKYLELIDKSINKNIHFHNKYIGQKEVSTYFSAADICVLPYKSATQSGIKAIADSFRVPVLTTNVGGLTELISNENNGFIIEDTDAKNFKNQIEQLFESELIKKVQNNLIHSSQDDEQLWFEFAQNLVNFALDLKSF